VNDKKLLAIKIMAGDKPEGKDYDKSEAHEATCPKCGHTWMMGDDSDDDSEDYDDED
jgi:hypothetical protein